MLNCCKSGTFIGRLRTYSDPPIHPDANLSTNMARGFRRRKLIKAGEGGTAAADEDCWGCKAWESRELCGCDRLTLLAQTP